MKNARTEVNELVDRAYRSQLDGIRRNEILGDLRDKANHDHELLVEAVIMLVEARNQKGNG